MLVIDGIQCTGIRSILEIRQTAVVSAPETVRIPTAKAVLWHQPIH